MPQLSSPLTTVILFRTVNFEPIEQLLKAFVGEIIEGVLFIARAQLVVSLDSVNALPTEALSTAGINLLHLSPRTSTMSQFYFSFNNFRVILEKLCTSNRRLWPYHSTRS